jgi:hypothetical protein
MGIFDPLGLSRFWQFACTGPGAIIAMLRAVDSGTYNYRKERDFVSRNIARDAARATTPVSLSILEQRRARLQ